MMTKHEQVRVLYDGALIDVDAGLVDVLEALWARGIETTYSCEGWAGQKLGYIQLPRGEDGLTLMQLIAAREPEMDWRAHLLGQRKSTRPGVTFTPELEPEPHPAPGEALVWDEWRWELSAVMSDGFRNILCTVRFPNEDIGKLLALLRQSG